MTTPLETPAPTAILSVDDVGLSWLVTVRWASVAGQVAAILVGAFVLGLSVPFAQVSSVAAVTLFSNALVTLRVAHGWTLPRVAAGLLVSLDTVTLTWILIGCGGPLNPLSIFFLVHIVMAALVLGRAWTWGVMVLSGCGYAVLFLATSPALAAAQTMHPEVAMHFRGMWWAFAATALMITVFVTKLAGAITRRDRALDLLRQSVARSERLASLATLAAGAAHELSTPLNSIAVAAHELERALEHPSINDEDPLADARLIRAEAQRCRRILDAMTADAGEAVGEMPTPTNPDALFAVVREALPEHDRDRLVLRGDTTTVTWPIRSIALAVGNLVRNGLQASPPGSPIVISLEARDDSRVAIVVADRGTGLTPEQLARVGEPFYTTKAAGEGLGLGVFVARTTVERLGGAFSIASTVGAGTIVTVVLPAHAVTSTASVK